MKLLDRIRVFTILIGITFCAYYVLNGFAILNPSNIAWLNYPGHNDPLQHYLGWEFFRHAPWGFPIGLNPAFGLDLSSSIIYSDSIPLLAFIFKPFNIWLSDPFQYMGMWYFFCYFFQALFAWLLAGLIFTNQPSRFLVAALFIFSPPLLWRVGEQAALAAHFLILAAIYLMLRPNQTRNTLWWCTLLILTALIQFYILAMILVLWLASIVANLVKHQWNLAAVKQGGLEFISVLTGLAIVFWVSGYFVIHVSEANTHHYGLMPLNLLALIDSGGWSILLKDIPNKSANFDQYGVMFGTYFESFNYLGLGYLSLIFFAFSVCLLKGFSQVILVIKKRIFLAAALFLLTFFAISNNIYFGPIQLISIPLPPFMFEFASILRASGRFFWPTFYTLILLALYLISINYSKKACLAILFLALSLQVIDLRPGWNLFAQWAKQAPSPLLKTPLQNPFWEVAAKQYERVEIIPLRSDFQWQNHWGPLSSYAAKYHLGTNAVFLSRVDKINLAKANERLQKILNTGRFDVNSLYILDQKKVVPALLHLNPNADLIAKIDGLNVLAPGWLKCLACLKIDPNILINTAFVPKLNKTILIRDLPQTNIPYIFAAGWDQPTPLGIESNSYESIIVLPLPSLPAESLSLNVRISPISKKLNHRLEFWIEDKNLLNTKISKDVMETITIPIGKNDRLNGYISLKVKLLDSSMDAPMDALGNSRFSGIELKSFIFR